ncbi:putative mediator of RNA polymerase II transcription subunit 15a/b/c [Helianthus debilis subsp. tardiflorus]
MIIIVIVLCVAGQILSSAVKTLSNHAAQSSQNLPNITFDDQMRQFHYQTPSVQQQQNLNQNQFQLQQVTGTSGDLISLVRQQQVRKMRAILSGNSESDTLRISVIYRQIVNPYSPVGFKTLDEFPSRDTYREYLFRQAATADDQYKLGKNASYLEKMLRFLNITSVDMVPEDDKRVYEYMNIIVNYMAFTTKAKPGGFFQHHVPVHQSPNGPSVQPPNPSQRATNQETNMVNFNQGFTSRRPQTEQSGMTSSSNITCFPIGLGSPISVFPNATATNLPFHQVNHQLPQMFSSEKMKQPMRKTNAFPKPKIRSGRSPLISSFDINGVVSSSSSRRGRSPLTTVETQKHTEPTGTRFRGPQTSEDAVHHLTQVVCLSLKHDFGTVLLSTTILMYVELLILITVSLFQAKSVSSKELSSSLTDISLMEKAADIIPYCMPTNLVGEYSDNNVNNKPHSKTRRELSVGPPEWDIYPTETSFNKKQKIENKWTLLEEIKEVNSILLETTIHAVLDPSEDNITILGDYEGIKLKCLFRNICFPDLLSPYGSISSEKVKFEFGHY